MPWTFSTDKLELIEEEIDDRDSPGPSSSRKGELRNVREFLETLSAQLAGGDGTLETTRVRSLYDHPAYLPSRSRSPARSSRSHVPSASGAHAQLKRLVARVVEEAAALPELARYAAEPTRLTPTIESSTYEDLLATAILNKVIERYQTENGSGGRSSGIHSASASPSPTPSERSSPRSLHSHSHHIHQRDVSPRLREEDVSDWDEGEATDDTLELPRRVPFPEFGGDIVHSTDNEDRDFDEVSSSDIHAVDGTWEENWLFQKKKIKNTQSVPVPMLVPNSNADYRVLIGDREADDTTDLSDNASDVEEDIEYKSDIKRIVDSKHVIGGSIKIQDNFDFEPDSLDVVDGYNDVEIENKNKENHGVADAINSEVHDESASEVQSRVWENGTIHKINETVNKEITQKTGYNELKKYAIKKPRIKSTYTNGFDENDNTKSVMVLGVDSGPLPKAEFALKEEIHRTIVNGHSEQNIEDQNNEFIKSETQNDTTGEIDIEKEFSLSSSTPSTLSRHQREREYNETIRIPVQRHVDSLRRKHFEDDEQQVPVRETDNEEDLIPGSVAYRERKKWLNYVEMPNNPYSPEAIQKRLSTKSNSSLFDMFTTKNKDIDEAPREITSDSVNGSENVWKQKNVPVKEIHHEKLSLTLSTENLTNGTQSKSPSPKVLKDTLAEELPQYKRYGRDYYIKEAKASSGGRKQSSFSDSGSLSSINKSTSLDNFDTDYASPVSASSSFSDLEACALHQNIVRTVFSPRNASPNFAINPIFEYTDKHTAEQNETDKCNVRTNVRQQSKAFNGDKNGVENEDIIRLKIPNKPVITEDLLETYNSVRRSDSLRSDDLNVRSKRQPGFNYTYGGSLRDY